MKKLSIKLLSVAFCILMLIPCFAFVSTGAEIQDGMYYCREALSTLPEGEKLVYAYDKIAEGVAVSASEINVYNGVDPISAEEVKIVYDAYRRDRTEHFWLGNSYTYSYNSDTVLAIKPDYIISGEELTNAKIKFESEADKILSGISPSMTEYEKEKYLHDALASKVTYKEAANAHNAYGAIVEGEAVCEGYAEALQYLLHRAGIQSLIVIGSSKNPSTGSSEGHAWNMVRINGKYYHLDLTWDDQGATTYYAYFNVSDTVIKQDHVIDETPYALPVCNSDTDNYFVREGGMLTSYTVDSVAQILKDNSMVARVYIPEGVSEFISWYKSNITAIASKAGISTAFSYSYSSIGNEVILIIDTCSHNSLSLVSKKPATCTENGNKAYYVCTCGKYFQDNHASKEILDKSSVILVASHSFTAKVEDEAHLRSTPATCAEYYTYYYGCTECNEISADKYYSSDKTLPHSPTLVSKVESTCSAEGKKAYYTCTCGRYFEDAGAKKEITDIENYGILPPSYHPDTDSFGRCTVCGELAEITDAVITLGLIGAGALIGLPIVIVILKRIFKRRR